MYFPDRGCVRILRTLCVYATAVHDHAYAVSDLLIPRSGLSRYGSRGFTAGVTETGQ